jgi:hypothetical protein
MIRKSGDRFSEKIMPKLTVGGLLGLIRVAIFQLMRLTAFRSET